MGSKSSRPMRNQVASGVSLHPRLHLSDAPPVARTWGIGCGGALVESQRVKEVGFTGTFPDVEVGA